MNRQYCLSRSFNDWKIGCLKYTSFLFGTWIPLKAIPLGSLILLSCLSPALSGLFLASKVYTVSKCVGKNLKNIHLWRLAIPLWDQLVTNQTCHFHRVYSITTPQLDLLCIYYLGWMINNHSSVCHLPHTALAGNMEEIEMEQQQFKFFFSI